MDFRRPSCCLPARDRGALEESRSQAGAGKLPRGHNPLVPTGARSLVWVKACRAPSYRGVAVAVGRPRFP
jgi:hypothetical protein